ncbi:MAG TPA: AI-2E family transporter [Steroidobacteraceae bacterium]|nr:AI-2E family transporter [Steroidobacteraceae bacterium]
MYSSFYRRTFVIGTIVILGWALAAILRPLWSTLGWAAVLAFLLNPLHERLTLRLKGRQSLSAGILTGLTPFFVMAPLAFLGVAFARQVAIILSKMSNSSLSYEAVLGRLDSVPIIGGLVRWVRDTAPVTAEQVKGWVVDGAQTVLKSAASMGGTVALGVMGSLVGFFMMLFLLFFLLRDGRGILARLTGFIPMEARPRGQLLAYLGAVTRAVVFGSVATAVAQGVCVGIGFALVGLPSPLVFAVLATIAAFLPAGSAIVLVPAVLYLVFAGRWGAAIVMLAWSAGVAVIDNVLRPFLTSRQAEVSTLAVFVGAIGGASAFGILGLVIGPVLLGFITALLQFAEKGVVTSD